METQSKPKIKNLFNQFSNPAGGFNTANSTSALPNFAKLDRRDASKANTLEYYLNAKNMGSIGTRPPALPEKQLVMPTFTPGPMSRMPAPGTPVPPVSNLNSVFNGNSPVPPSVTAPVAPTPTTANVPAQYKNADGTMKTPEQVAAEIAATLKKNSEVPDIGRLAGNEFGGAGKTAEQLRAEATQINNTRNDISVGENDPYKVAAQSGIAYSPAELRAIEQAYAGVYDPAITTAMAKMEAKQASDATAAENKAKEEQMRLQASLDASAPYTLGKDQVRYGADGQPIAVGLSDSPTSVSTYTPGSNPNVDAYVKGIRNGTYKASDVPDEYKGMVAQGMSATQPKLGEGSVQAISVITELLSNPAIDRIAGLSSLFPIIPGGDASTAATLAKQLKGMLSLESREKLAGSGAISDFEFKVLGQAASALGIDDNTGRSSLSEEEFKFQLDKLKLKLEVGETQMTDDELIFLRDSGYTPEQIREYNQQQSFPSVGNTTVSASTGSGNRPQRNNNPGNVKAGGLADSFAVGQDDQGHLIFPDANTGFKALSMDLGAKINGGSRYLPANPTIAQLGKVYAEDSNWPNSVARMLGVDPSTPTQSIPFDSLLQAIAKQEGFYA